MLRIERLTAGYRADSPVLHGLGLELPPGRITALLGRNGMGKSTLLRAVMGLIPVMGGRILLDGRPITGLPPEVVARQGVAYVPQGRGLFADLSVEENLALGAMGRLRVDLLERFPILAERRRQRAGSLSGGEQQQLALARALASNPRLLLLDEPSEGVQPSLVERIGETLRELVTAEGITVLLVEQNLDLVEDTADGCLFIEKGAIMASTPAGTLRADPALLEQYLGI
jgi:ABC-type branched-subunit amino acid transport system ATPase component